MAERNVSFVGANADCQVHVCVCVLLQRRRSARNMGRRKRYVDDLDVNLSDYEETGDSDDERAKARKKMKYELKDSDEMDSSDEAPKVKVLPTPAPPTTTGADTLVQASVYYEPPEEEANVVEKVLSHRTRPSKVAGILRCHICTAVFILLTV